MLTPNGIALAITAAGVCFLLFPLRMGTTHENVGGFYGSLFALLGGFDKPYNLVPSLHIALLTILWSVYSRHTRGRRGPLGAWFVLIAASTLLTGQHHVIDLAGGFFLGWLCLYLVPDERSIIPGTNSARASICNRRRFARRTGVPAAAVGVAAALAGDIAGCACRGICEGGPGCLREVGRPCPLVLAGPARAVPRRQPPLGRLSPPAGGPMVPACTGVWLGRRPSNAEARELVRLGVSAVLDVTAEYSEAPALLGLNYKNLPVLDLTTPPLGALDEGAAFIEEHATRGVYVHCALGYSRSVCFAAAWLLKAGLADSARARNRIHPRGPSRHRDRPHVSCRRSANIMRRCLHATIRASRWSGTQGTNETHFETR